MRRHRKVGVGKMEAIIESFNSYYIVAQWDKNEKIMQLQYKELLHKCERGNKIAPLRHKCQAMRGTPAEVVQLYSPSKTYPAFVFLLLFYCILEQF